MRIAASFILAALLALATPVAGAAGLIVQDDEGRILTLAHPARRIVSLAPGATEMLFAAGAGDLVIATVEYADEPAAARRIPRVGNAQAFDVEKILALRPDVVVVWSTGNSAASIASLERVGLPLYRHAGSNFAELSAALRRMGVLAGTKATANLNASALDLQLRQLIARPQPAKPLNVFVQVWDHPLYTIGASQPISQGLRLCGAANLFDDLRDPSPVVSTEAVLARNPDAIVAVANAASVKDWLADWRRFTQLAAVQRGNLLAFDDPALTRAGPGSLKSVARLCEVLDAARAR